MRPAAQRNHRSGFTLMELLVVVAIIGVLAAMLMPTITMVRSAAEATRCVSNIRQLALGAVAFSVDNEGNLPSAGISWGYSSWTTGSNGRWMHFIDPYLENFTVFNCPASSKLRPKFRILNATGPVSWGTAQRGSADVGWVCLYAYNTTHWGRYPDMPAPKGPMNASKVSSFLATYDPAYTAANCPLFTDGVTYFDVTKTGQYAYFLNNSWGAYFPHRRRQSTAFIDGRVKSSSFADFTIVGTSPWMGAIQVL